VDVVDEGSVRATIWDGAPLTLDQYSFERKHRRHELRFTFDLFPSGEHGWRQTTGERSLFRTEALADHLARWYLTNARA
jgi:hypothetical protein